MTAITSDITQLKAQPTGPDLSFKVSMLEARVLKLEGDLSQCASKQEVEAMYQLLASVLQLTNGWRNDLDSRISQLERVNVGWRAFNPWDFCGSGLASSICCRFSSIISHPPPSQALLNTMHPDGLEALLDQLSITNLKKTLSDLEKANKQHLPGNTFAQLTDPSVFCERMHALDNPRRLM